MELNLAFWLSLILAAAGCSGLILAGKGKWYGWAVGLAVQPVWATYAIVTKGYGLLITCLMYGIVNARNLWKWRKENGPAFKQTTFVYCPGCRQELVNGRNRIVMDTDLVRYFCGECNTISAWMFDAPVPLLIDSFYSDPSDWLKYGTVPPPKESG